MRFLPEKEGNTIAMTRLPAYRLQLKSYIEKTMIPAIIKHEGHNFWLSLSWGGQSFTCDLYNDVWEKYAQERPFEISDFRLFEATTEGHKVLYVEVPVLSGMEELCNYAIAFASDYSGEYYNNIRLYRIKKYEIEDEMVIFEVYCPDERIGCTPPIPAMKSNNAQDAIVNLICRMAFDESDGYDEMFEFEDLAEEAAYDEMLKAQIEEDESETKTFLSEWNAQDFDDEWE